MARTICQYSESEATYTKEDPELVYSVTWYHLVNVIMDLTFTKLVPLMLFVDGCTINPGALINTGVISSLLLN